MSSPVVHANSRQDSTIYIKEYDPGQWRLGTRLAYEVPWLRAPYRREPGKKQTGGKKEMRTIMPPVIPVLKATALPTISMGKQFQAFHIILGSVQTEQRCGVGCYQEVTESSSIKRIVELGNTTTTSSTYYDNSLPVQRFKFCQKENSLSILFPGTIVAFPGAVEINFLPIFWSTAISECPRAGHILLSGSDCSDSR